MSLLIGIPTGIRFLAMLFGVPPYRSVSGGIGLAHRRDGALATASAAAAGSALDRVLHAGRIHVVFADGALGF